MKQLIVTIVIMVTLAIVAANAVLDNNVGLAVFGVLTNWALVPVAFRQAAVAERREQRLNGN